MYLVAEGLSNKQIALQLGISPRTVENYRAWAMERMGASNLARSGPESADLGACSLGHRPGRLCALQLSFGAHA